MNKPVIGIISKPNVFCEDKLFTQQIVYDGVRNAILKNGGVVIGILPTQILSINKFSDEIEHNKELPAIEEKDLYTLIDRCDGVILQGGLSSEYYEILACKYTIENNIPLLGICAGFNNIIRAMDGSVSFINDKRHNQEDGKIAHKNIIKKNSMLYEILNKEEIDVNSIHEMFARREDIKNLEIVAYSDDGYVEAVELKNKSFCLGVKWHPELMIDDENMNNIFKKFIEKCKK